MCLNAVFARSSAQVWTNALIGSSSGGNVMILGFSLSISTRGRVCTYRAIPMARRRMSPRIIKIVICDFFMKCSHILRYVI